MTSTKVIAMATSCGVVTFGLCYYPMGTSLGWAVVLALLVTAVALPTGLLSGVADVSWAPVPELPETLAESQATMLSTRLASAADDPRRFVTRVRPQLRRIALATLRRRPGCAGLTSLDDPRAKIALGTELHTLLTVDGTRLPAPGRLAAMLRQLEES